MGQIGEVEGPDLHAGVPQALGVGAGLGAQRVVTGCGHHRRRQAGEIGGAQGAGEGVAGVMAPEIAVADPNFVDPLDVKLNDCSSRIEWLSAAMAYGIGSETQLDPIFQDRCKEFLHPIVGSLPIPAACEGQ